MTDNRHLPKKEADMFRNVVKFYEGKQYKKGIKQADLILKKFPDHGETLCMKGLTLNSLKKRDEAHALVKLGLMKDMRSHVCWHVYGLLHRADRNYNEAIKAYKQALRIDKENLQILKDLSLLQIQMRDLAGFATTRLTLLQLKPTNKFNWISYALARHANGELDGALKVIDSFLNTQEEGSPERERGFEPSELMLYRNEILAAIPNNYEQALQHLFQIEAIVVDRGAWLMMKAKYEVHLGRHDEARETLLSNLDRGLTEDYRVHSGYMCALLELDGSIYDSAVVLKGTNTIANTLALSAEQRKKLLDAYQGDIQSRYPRSQAVHRIPLTLMEGDDFKSGIDKYCRKRLSKGVPSLAMDLSTFLVAERNSKLYRVTDPVDVKANPVFPVLVDLADSYISSLEGSSKFSASDEDEEPSSTLLWAWYLRAGLFELAGEYIDGIRLLDKCLEHTSTAVDVYEMKARLQKIAGDIESAVETLDKGRDNDQQDRYINNQTTKYMLQAGMEETALKRIGLFTKHEGNPEDNLYNMQCSWYEIELGECLRRKGQFGKSLKKFGAVVKHFDDFHEDQFDFHSYCIRKVTLRAYRQVLKWEDELWGLDYYGRAAEGIIKVYLHLNDNPAILKADEEPDYSKMTPAERKKAKNIARKKKKAAEKKAAEEAERKKAEEAKAAADGKKKKTSGLPAIVDDDPDGLELLKLTPLEEAKKYSGILSKYAPKRITTWFMQYDVAMRRGKALMALQALFKAKALDNEDADLFSRIVDFSSRGAAFRSGMNATAKNVLEQQMTVLLEKKDLETFVSDSVDRIRSDPSTPLPQRVAVAEAWVTTDKSITPSKAAELVLDGGLDSRMASLERCLGAIEVLQRIGATDSANTFRDLVKVRFPLATQLR